LPSRDELGQATKSFSKREWLIFLILAFAMVGSVFAILENLNHSFMVRVPARGGALSEGSLGSPRFVNPVLASSAADKDVAALIYSGLLRKSEEGLLSDLAEKYEMAEDGLSYTFTLRDNAFFHDGEKVTANDVVFTVNKVKDPIIKSPRAGGFEGVLAEAVDERTVRFTLRERQASFLENLTLGILPGHIYEGTPIELADANIRPVGSGPFKVEKVNRESGGLVSSYELGGFSKFTLGEPFIKKITIRFYPGENELLDALARGEIDTAGSLSPGAAEALKAKDNYRILSATLPRIFGLFFNQNQNRIFLDKNVVRAIELGIDKERIVNEVLRGYGEVISSPIPPALSERSSEKSDHAAELAEAEEILSKAGWEKNETGQLEKQTTENKKKITMTLAFSISTGNASELMAAAERIREDLALLGIAVEVKSYEAGNLTQGVIRPRQYDALLFGQIVNRASDLYAFWHSSQRKDPGLNIALYTSAKVDKILETAHGIADPEERAKKYLDFENEIKKDRPAIFLYSPKFIYATRADLLGLKMSRIVSPEERFAGTYLWYLNTDNVWKIFTKNSSPVGETQN